MNIYESLWLLITINDWIGEKHPKCHIKNHPPLGDSDANPGTPIPRQFHHQAILGFCAYRRKCDSPGISCFCLVLAVLCNRGWQEWWCAKSIKITERSPWFVGFCWIWVASGKSMWQLWSWSLWLPTGQPKISQLRKHRFSVLAAIGDQATISHDFSIQMICRRVSLQPSLLTQSEGFLLK